MYQEKLAIAVKHNGRVLREHGDTVYVPYGSEYTLHFKNLNSLRALVRVEIDGQDATIGTSLIVPANGTVDLERFLREGDGGKGNRFKFIERTAKIEDGPRGIKVEDGLIRVEFEFERQPSKIEDITIRRTYVNDYWPRYYPTGPIWYCNNTISGSLTSTAGQGGTLRSVSSNSVKLGAAAVNNISASIAGNAGQQHDGVTCSYTAQTGVPSAANLGVVQNAIGITVPGSVSDQKFEVGAWFPTDGQKHVMVLKLMGMVGEKVVKTPVTVKTKQKCVTCGHVNKSGAKFCSECGTGLEIA